MIKVDNNLFVGDERDYEFNVSRQDGWAIVHACKDPYHRQALGYRTRGAPKDHPEYLVARRGNRLILNIVDANDPSFFAKEMIDQALDFIDKSLSNGKKVLVHCNQGESRSPSIALYIWFQEQMCCLKIRLKTQRKNSHRFIRYTILNLD